MPPVARTEIAASRHAASVAPTVVAPSAPSTMQAARSRGLTLRASDARCGDPLELLVVEPDAKRAVDDGDGRRHRAAVAHALLALLPDGESLAWREAVRDDRRLQSDDGPPCGQCLLDLT